MPDLQPIYLTLSERASLVALIRLWEVNNPDNITPPAMDLRQIALKLFGVEDKKDAPLVPQLPEGTTTE